ncbi:MAG: SDR family oxidoreductase [Planctomycetes bacterium]|nr:SDR family oxidoreductase [Planctomycetota bacterium]
MKRLAGKIALVTGGGSGIGLGVAKAFLGEGARVAIAGRTESRLREAAKSLASDSLMTHAADLADPDAVRSLIKTVTDRLGPIDILVNNAGLNIKERTFRELTPDSWQLLLRANLDSAFYCTHEVLPAMLKRKDGLIINVSSIAGKRAGPLGGAAYAASKFGMSALGICLAAEEKDSGIRVSNIYPGEVDTPILEVRPQAVSAEHRHRILKPEDVAAAVLFVATLPPHVSIPELVIKPTWQVYV